MLTLEAGHLWSESAICIASTGALRKPDTNGFILIDEAVFHLMITGKRCRIVLAWRVAM